MWYISSVIWIWNQLINHFWIENTSFELLHGANIIFEEFFNHPSKADDDDGVSNKCNREREEEKSCGDVFLIKIFLYSINGCT